MIEEALWEEMGLGWMVIIGHRYSRSTFGANNMIKIVTTDLQRAN